MHIVHQSTTTEQSSTLLMTVSSHYYKSRRNPLQKILGVDVGLGMGGIGRFHNEKLQKFC